MKKKITEIINLPEGVSCSLSNGLLICKKGAVELSRFVNVPSIHLLLNDGSIILETEYGNKKQLNVIMSLTAHIRNLFSGLEKRYVYKMQACNVHFPMTLKVESDRLAINNFLGEKKPRYADILPNVEVEVKGQNISVYSHDKESAGQTAANIEKATKVRNRDRRVFQDGIYIVEKTMEEA